VAGPHQGQDLLEERGLAGPGAGHQADHEQAGLREALAQGARQQVVLLEDVFADFQKSGLSAHASISSAATTSSRPCSTSAAGAPQAAQKSAAAETARRRPAHAGQWISTGSSSITSREPASAPSRQATW